MLFLSGAWCWAACRADSALLSCRPRAFCLADSDEESSSAGSSDEDDAPEPSAGDKPLLPGAEG